MSPIGSTFLAPTLIAFACAGALAGCENSTTNQPAVGIASTLSSSPSPSPSATTFAITVVGGKAQGGLQQISAKTGSAISITVTTSDTTSELHLHGYDLMRTLAPGAPAVFSFDALIPGVFELELEDTSVKIADLTVK